MWISPSSPPFRSGRAEPGCPGFTLLEVVLAIGIAIGLLAVVLFFYRQIADLRTQLLTETERLSAVRLLMERLTADLRGARGDFYSGQGLSGDATSLQFVKVGLAPATAWVASEWGRAAAAHTDLNVVSYGVSSTALGTNLVVTGFRRAERPLVDPRPVAEENHSVPMVAAPTENARLAPEALTEAIRFVRFRYWDGASWLDSWNGVDLPQGVEVSFGCEPLPEETAPEDYPYELFRRTIYLPGYEVIGGDIWWFDVIEGSSLLMEEFP